MRSLVRCLVLLLVLAPAAVAQRPRADTLVVHFAFDRSVVRPADSTALRDANRGADSILVLGYTDTVGSNAYNLRLSYRRAQSTQKALLQFITQTARVSAQAAPAPQPQSSAQPQPPAAASTPPIRLDPRGETNPLPGDDSLSRRVEIIVYYHLKDTPAIVKAPPIDTPRARPDDEPDTAFGLDNINFIANTPTLTDAAKEALPHSVAYLRNFADRYLEIDGFCNQPGPPLKPKDPLFILSVHRAKFIYEYLIAQGFDSTHLRYKGLGNTNPVNAHPTTAHEMDQNMRVEIRVFRKPQPQQQQ
jgi:outer membrane protein OmpA-like peptidoglycan-associated protein